MKRNGQNQLTLMPRLKAQKVSSVLRPNVESFYHLPNGVAGKCCRGTACFVARHLDKGLWNKAERQPERVFCLGKCYIAPACDDDDAHPTIRVASRVPVIFERMAQKPVRTIGQYIDGAGCRALLRSQQRPRDEIVREIETSQLRGRGGAAFLTGKKWRAVFEQRSLNKYVIANADEGDAGSYIDRFIIEDDPHALIEGMAIAGFAIGAQKGIVYLRAEYPRARVILEQAIQEVRQLGLLQNRSDGFIFDIDVVSGKGSYLCGEETALVNAIEHKRPVAMARPPYAAERGLFGRPTLIDNVETLATIPWIIRNGGENYAALGFSKSRGTKVICLNSLFRRPGLYEVEFGISLRNIVEELGGGLRDGELRGLMVGGPLAGVIPPRLLDTPFGFEELHAIKGGIGHGGIVAFDERTTIAQLVQYIFSFGAYESCGKCTPCRLGTREVEQLFDRIEGKMDGENAFDELIAALKFTSLCGHGMGLAEFAESVAHHYKEELRACFMSP